MIGLIVDWQDYDRIYNEAGLIPPKDHTPDRTRTDASTTTTATQVGYATSFMYSPMLQRHIALARVRPELADAGTEVNLEFTINHRYEQVAAPTPLPLDNPLVRRLTTTKTTSLEPTVDEADTKRRPHYDAIVIGGGHNGLVNGAYLAKAGLRTLILERRHLVGGAAITEELLPGLPVHDVLVRAEPAAARHHPRTRADQARLHAAADAVDVRARWRTATTC